MSRAARPEVKREVQADKVTLARESRGLTQTEFADRLGISQGQVSKVEMGMQAMPEGVLARAATVLNYPEALFCATDPVYGAGPNDLYHRKRQSTSAGLMRQIYAQINLRRIQVARLLKSVAMSCNVPRYAVEETDAGDVGIAAMIRSMWHLSPGPIDNLTGLFERAGAIVVPCNFGTLKVDGFSQWLPGHPPMFFMSTTAPRSRWRWTLAHEFAHLVMHSMPNEDMERQADRFASEFLVPAGDVRQQFQILSGYRRADDVLSRLVELKLIWKVSMQALLTKAADMGVISQALVTSTWKRLNQLGYRRNEPFEHKLPLEQPTSLRALVSRHLDGLGYSITQLAEALLLTVDEFRQLYMPQETAHLRVV